MRTANYQFVVWAVFTLLICFSGAQSRIESQALKVSMCDLFEHPEQYAGKMVAVSASVSGHDLSLDDYSKQKPCAAYMSVHLELPHDVKPKPSFDLIRDEMSTAFFDGLHKGMNVVATYEGRFDPVFVWRDRKRIRVSQEEDKGFGKKHQYDARLVVQRISDVVARPVPRK